jgi:arylsulfatase A-like enzyme/Flp pilus assembly protein TadD
VSGQRTKNRRWIGLLAAASIITIGAASYLLLLRPRPSSIARDSGLNVLLITLDTTRADRLGCYGYARAATPNIDALARQGVLFANAYAPVPLTLPSHCSILTGTLPISHLVRNNGTYIMGPEQVTLAEVLKDKGFRTAAFVASFSVDSRFGLSQGFELYDDNFQEDAPFKALNSERTAEQVYQIFSAWLEKLEGGPFFAWVHFFDPHAPYNPPSPYRENFEGRPYDGEVAYMDFMVGAVLSKLRQKGLLARTLVAVAGDHGEAFGEKGESGHGVFLYEMAVRVPMLFFVEGRIPKQRVISGRVRLIDIFPTVLDILSVPAPPSVQGKSLLPYLEERKNKDLECYLETFYPRENFGWSPLAGLISGRWKYIRAPKEELYDLRADPDEQKNAAGPEKEIVAKMRALMEQLEQSSSGSATGGRRTPTAEEQARLRSLGYVDYSDPTAKGGDDPKDKVDELRLVQEAEKLEFEGNFQGAAELHKSLLTLHPRVATGYINLALAQARQLKFDQAIATLRLGLEKIPGSELLLSRLGYTYLVTGRMSDALATMKQVLDINPGNIEALTATAVMLDNQGSKEEAQSFFEKALAVEPENKFLRLSYASNLSSSGKLKEAIAVYIKIIEDYPRDTAAYQALGIAYGQSGDFDQAIAAFKESTYINPTQAAYFNLALAYRQKGEFAEAVRYFERYLENPKDEPEKKVKMARSELERLRSLR